MIMGMVLTLKTLKILIDRSQKIHRHFTKLTNS
jgi:hypothetical protein